MAGSAVAAHYLAAQDPGPLQCGRGREKLGEEGLAQISWEDHLGKGNACVV
jgi:hypothetical protein